MDTPRLRATSLGGEPFDRSFLADSTLLSVITLLRPPTLPRRLAAFKPARVRSLTSSRSICARLAMTWKKKRPAGLPVSIWSVRLLKWILFFSRFATKSISPLTLRPKRSSFQTTKVSPSRSWSIAWFNPGRLT